MKSAYRKNQADSVYSRSYYYLENYFDSSGVSNSITRYYSSAIELDKKNPLQVSRISALKTYYEGLILSHPDNEKMIRMLFYFVQKAKIALKDYTGAMSGLQQIMNQSPYSYEGLIASWDYMSAYVLSLDSAGGSGGGENENIGSFPNASFGNPENDCIDNQLDSDNPLTKSKPVIIRDDFDRKKFNSSQREQITKVLFNTLTKTKHTADEEIKKLKDDADHGNKKAKQQLEEKKALNESVKTKKPANNIQLIQILNNDIKKVFHKERSGSDTKKPLDLIPHEYKLNQNYPNPFNPVTKISFSIPVDSKVKLVIYDILGREVQTLINDELRQPGNYIMEFNGSALASGIYFYLLAAEGSQNFTQVKKMVLVK